MPAIVVAAAVAACFFLGWRFYSPYVAQKIYGLDPTFTTPAHEFEDGVDYVPTNKHVLFGHHFTSIAGAAPIVGPAIAVFWGWLPALAWVVLGTIFAAGVHDFGSLVVSVRNKAQSIGTLTTTVINKRARSLFLVIIFFLLVLVNAVFAVVISILFEGNPAAVIPIFLEIPLAIGIGQYIYRTRSSALLPSILGVIVLYLSILVGREFPIDITGFAESIGLSARTVWVVILFAYTWIASQLPVWLLLQPRDYINSHQLFIGLGVIFLGIAVGFDRIVAPAVNSVPEGSPNWFPFLFITVACGAVSGFHSLVSSGTTSKQLDKDTDARYVGYLGSVGEGSLATGAILATTAGVGALGAWQERYADFATASDGALGGFVAGVGHFAGNLGVPLDIGTVFAAVIVVSFAATTMDTGVRLQRYIVQEIGEILSIKPLARNTMALATTTAVLVPLLMALLPGGGEVGYAFGRLWQLFGTTNQLTAGLALTVVAVWVVQQGRNATPVLIPLVFLLAMTSWALFLNLQRFIRDGDWVLAPLDAIIFGLALWLIVESFGAFRRAGRPTERIRERVETGA